MDETELGLSPEAQRWIDNMTHYALLGEKVLTALPEDPDELARWLGTHKVKAQCGNTNKCALAEYLNIMVPLPEEFMWSVDFTETTVEPSYSHLRQNPDPLSSKDREAVLKHADKLLFRHGHTEFISLFDSHRYPDLEKK